MYYLSGTNKNIKYIYKYINLKAFIYLFKFNKGVYYKGNYNSLKAIPRIIIKARCRLTGLNSRVPGHGIRIVLYALVGLLTIVVLLK